MSGTGEKIRLRILGITYNQIQSGAYALILSEDRGTRRIPIVIGSAEAQSIAAKLENVALPRPLVHDMFQAMTHAFGIIVKEVFIYKFGKGVFFSEITFADGDREVRIDSRTSDAIAIALRTKSPIYTTPEVLEETGFEAAVSGMAAEEDEIENPLDSVGQIPLDKFAVEELEKMLKDCIEREAYERAAEIKGAIERKQEISE